MSATVTLSEQQHALGASVPPFTAHAISVSLPTWDDNVGYEEGDKRVVNAMVSGYPRFFIHLSIQKLARICEQKFGMGKERCILCPTRRIAEQCRAFMIDRSTKAGSPVPVRLVQFLICPESQPDCGGSGIELHIVFFPEDSFPLAKQFWQHTGLCISSRLAERCLSMLPEESSESKSPVLRAPSKAQNRHYARNNYSGSPPASPVQSSSRDAPLQNIGEVLDSDRTTYLEERYGRNLPLESAAAAKKAMRRRIAGVLVRDAPNDWSVAGGHDAELGPSTRGVEEVTEDDVYLYSTGMSAIWSAHQLALGARPPAKSICFGFPYTDTLKILEKWGPGCHFLGRARFSQYRRLPVLALFTEFPSNPLLRCADLSRLRSLADKYNFLIVIDETIGNFVNVEVLPYADVVVSSLSKIFSGDANAMGGSLVLNPKGRHYGALKTYLEQTYEDSYFDEDAIYMERNSRDFKQRIATIDANTLAVCSCAIKDVLYPTWVTREHYDRCRVRGADGKPAGGFGGLFSLVFTSTAASRAFFDTLPCLKGPSLGTNFTLASPYTILAHYAELDWAAQYGVEEGLVRVSVGLEDTDVLLRKFEKALLAAEAVTES
ncbi:PLP-dependent transferase [Amylocystis lapponica]|nr:PLP-dependent transferase [Amylocystis lapponica]